MHSRHVLAAALAAAVTLGGCAGLTDTQQRTLTGTAAGTAGGAVIGAIAGNAGLGALIGAGVGAGGGYLYGVSKENQQRAYAEGYQQGRASGPRY
jgi:osmotically inducible lipoprotein OsmB